MCCDSESEYGVKSRYIARGGSILNHDSALDGDQDARSGHWQKSTDSCDKMSV